MLLMKKLIVAALKATGFVKACTSTLEEVK